MARQEEEEKEEEKEEGVSLERRRFRLARKRSGMRCFGGWVATPCCMAM